MPETLTVHEPLLVNLLGHSAGAVIFAIFLYLVLWSSPGARLRGNWPAVAAASLALLWNIASLVALIPETGGHWLTILVIVAGWAALSLLPAVLLHVSLDRRFRPIVAGGYLLSLAAIAIHSSELVVPAPSYHRNALILITIGFGGLTIAAAAALLLKKHPDRRRLTRVLGTMSLFLFAMSFVHLSVGEVQWTWPIELLVHHAGIPLALFVLLQDYRFVLLDAFIRFLTNILLAAGFTFLGTSIASRLSLFPLSSGNPFQQALLLVGSCAFLILFAVVRSEVQRLLTRIVFWRSDLDGAIRELRTGDSAGEMEYFDWAAGRMAAFMAADPIRASGEIDSRLRLRNPVFPSPVDALPELRHELEAAGAEIVAPVRISPAETRYVLLGRRRGGRRYLSEDLQALARLAAQAGERIEQARETEMRRLVSQAELRALQSQIHPHFLFNALNTLYGVIPKNAQGARRTVLNLADIFRYFLQTDRTYIPLEDELNIVRAYLEIESLRLGGKLRTELDIDDNALRQPIPVLSIEPLVENAVKHGVAARSDGGMVRLKVVMRPEGLEVSVYDSGGGFADPAARGVGLENVTRRLKLCYGPDAGLEIESGAEGTVVRFRTPAAQAVEARS